MRLAQGMGTPDNFFHVVQASLIAVPWLRLRALSPKNGM
jgi:hypothetical protein